MKNKEALSILIITYLTAAGFGGILLSTDCFINSNAQAAAIIVDPSGTGNFTKIQDAIDHAKAGDTIYIRDGMYNENIIVNKTLTIIGNGTSRTIINGSYMGDVVHVCADWVNLTGFTATNSGQQPGFLYESGIKLQHADFVTIYNVVSINNDYPVFLNDSHYNRIEKCNLSLNAHGTHIIDSDNNYFVNNSNINSGNGLIVKNSDYTKILNNTFGKIYYTEYVSYEINLENAKSAVVKNNKMNFGFYIWGEELAHWNSHTIDSSNRVKGKTALFWKDRKTGTVPVGCAQVILANCSGVTVSNYSFEKATYGIVLGYSSNNIIKNNKAANSSGNIFLMHSHKNYISANSAKLSNYNLILIYSDNNTIKDNSATSCKDGLFLYTTSNYNKIFQNDFNSNDICGMHITSSDNNRIYKNNVTGNWGGIVLKDSKRNLVENNYAASNSRGVLNRNSNYNDILNNNVSNCLVGVELEKSDLNYVNGNIAEKNTWHGISLIYADNNLIENNTISSNQDSGINLESADRNAITVNTISLNINGISFSSSNFNRIYYNNILYNNQQAVHTGTNYWNNSFTEGNYWSDYSGADDGSAGRVAGDGIGDTNIPHLGLDNYPFMQPSGWKLLRTPKLSGPVGIVTDGSYTIFWNWIASAEAYVLEEDLTAGFDSPEVIYTGSGTSSAFKYKDNGTYYYRIRCHNTTHSSTWSTSFAVIVDWLPDIPAGLSAEAYPPGNAVNISWTTNSADTKLYELQAKTTGQWSTLAQILHPAGAFNHTGLSDGLEYYYRIKACDYRDQFSSFSQAVGCKPTDIIPPDPPKDLKAVALGKSEIGLTWRQNTEDDIEGYLVFMNTSSGGNHDKFNLIGSRNKTETSFIATGLSEKMEYYFKIKAIDEVPNNSSFSNMVSALTTDETPPAKPVGLVIKKRTSDTLTVAWEPNTEPDLAGYHIYRSQKPDEIFSRINTELITNTEFVDSGLLEAAEYYYRMAAVDESDLESAASDIIAGKTLHAPAPPEFVGTVSDLVIKEDSYDDSINLSKMFIDINDDPLQFSCSGHVHIGATINYATGSVLLRPEHDWNGEETLTFQAFDGMFNSSCEILVTVTAVNDPPGMVIITEPANGQIFKEADRITFIGTCTDPDLPGDMLVFTWYSNISTRIGVGASLKNIVLSPGLHKITLKVEDRYGEVVMTAINITVEPGKKTVPDNNENDKNNENDIKSGFYLALTTAAVITIVIVMAILFLIRRKKIERAGELNTLTGPANTVNNGPQDNLENQNQYNSGQLNGTVTDKYSHPQIQQPAIPLVQDETDQISQIMEKE